MASERVERRVMERVKVVVVKYMVVTLELLVFDTQGI